MAYNPGISYRGDQYISAGISNAANSVSKYFRDKRAEEDELEMQRGVLLGRYGSDGQFGGSEKLGEPAGAAGEPGYGGAPMNQADAGVAEQLGESAGAAGEPGASSGGIFGMFGRSNRPTAPAKTKATDSQTAESKGFKGLQAFASSEYNIPVEATTAMSKNALKGFLVGLEQRRTAEGQAQDRARQERQAQSAERLSAAQIINLAAQAQDLKQKQITQEKAEKQAENLDRSMQNVPESGVLNRFAMPSPDSSSLLPGTLNRYAGAPPEERPVNLSEAINNFMKFGTPEQKLAAARLMADSDNPVSKLNAEANFINANANKINSLRLNTPPPTKPTVTIEEIVNGVPVKRSLTASEFEAWKAKNPDKATEGLQANLKKLLAAQAAGKKEIDLDQLMGDTSKSGIDLNPWWGGKPIEDGIKYLETMLGGGAGAPATAPATGKKRKTVIGPNGQTGTVEDGTKLPAGWSYK